MPKFKNSRFEYYWYALFEAGIFIKGFNGIWETISGFLILFFHKVTFNNFIYLLARKELVADPHDKFINFIAQFLQNLSANTKTFAAIYLLLRGLLNIFLAIQLYRNKLWAYLATIGFMLVFVSYQAYRIALYHSKVLTSITVFDLLFVILIWHEYRFKTKQPR